MQKPLDNLITETREKYRSIGRVWCNVLNSDVHFTAEGFVHLIYKGNRKKRNVKEQRYKLDLFGLVIPAVKHCKDLATWRFLGEPGDKNDVQYYAITHLTGKRRDVLVRVIIKRTGDGQFNFHSVMKENKKPR